MPCVPGGRSCRFKSSTTPAPFSPVPLSTIVTVPTLLPWASFISTTVLAALASEKRAIVDDTAATKNCLCFMGTDYNQAISRALFDHRHRRAVIATMQIRLTRRLVRAFPFWDGVYCLVPGTPLPLLAAKS